MSMWYHRCINHKYPHPIKICGLLRLLFFLLWVIVCHQTSACCHNSFRLWVYFTLTAWGAAPSDLVGPAASVRWPRFLLHSRDSDLSSISITAENTAGGMHSAHCLRSELMLLMLSMWPRIKFLEMSPLLLSISQVVYTGSWVYLHVRNSELETYILIKYVFT